jgi:hypothetical protein
MLTGPEGAGGGCATPYAPTAFTTLTRIFLVVHFFAPGPFQRVIACRLSLPPYPLCAAFVARKLQPQPRFRFGKSKSNPRGLNQAAGTFLPAGSNAAHSPGLTTNKVFRHAFSYRKTERHPCRRRTNAGCLSARTEGGKGGSLFSAGWKGVSHLSARQQKAPGTEFNPIHGAVCISRNFPPLYKEEETKYNSIANAR